MMEFSLEDDLPEEFKGGTLSLRADDRKPTNESHRKSIIKNNNSEPSGKDTAGTTPSSGKDAKSVVGSSGLITSSAVPDQQGTNNKDVEAKKSCMVHIGAQKDENANDYFTFRKGVVETAIKECVEQFLDEEDDGPLLSAYLLTEINIWNSNKERLVLISANTLVTVKYDFIALKRLEYKKIPLDCVDTVLIGDLVYPPASLVPHIEGVASGLSDAVQNCLLSRWSKSSAGAQSLTSAFRPRKRNIRGVRLMWNKGKNVDFGTKWNPFTDNVPFLTFTFHPLYFHKDCTDDSHKSLYNLEEFVDKICDAITNFQRRKSSKNVESCIIHHKDILLENYLGLGSVIHNHNALGFFKVRGKFSF